MWTGLDPAAGAREKAKAKKGKPGATFKVGDLVWSKYQGAGRYPGKVDAVNANGTYAVEFDDGDYQEDVLLCHMKYREPQATQIL